MSGLDGKPRELHVHESLASIDFTDVEPPLVNATPASSGHFSVRALVRHRLFDADLVHADMQDVMTFDAQRLRVIAVVNGRVRATGGGVSEALEPGDFCVLPASLTAPALAADQGSTFLHVEAGP